MPKISEGKSKEQQAIDALSAGQIKYAMQITNSTKHDKAHKIVVETAKKCVADKEKCQDYLKEGVAKLTDMITPTTADNDGLEELLKEEDARSAPSSPDAPLSQESPESPPEPPDKPTAVSSEDAYLDCQECHVAAAAVEFVKIAEKDGCDGSKISAKLQPLLDDQNTTPEKWLKTMTEITEEATCDKVKYGEVLGELTDYLQEKKSEFLTNIDKG
jgi:hypothetical protein